MYARVVVIAGSASLYGTYTYEVAEALSETVKIGDCVLVPFSSGEALGYVVEILTEKDTNIEYLKNIKAVVQTDIKLDRGLFSLAQAISNLFITSLPSAVRSILPSAMRGWLRYEISLSSDTYIGEKLNPSEEKLLSILQRFNGKASLAELRKHTSEHTLTKTLSSLRKKGLIERKYYFEPPKVKAKTVKAAALGADDEEIKKAISSFGAKQIKRSRALQVVLTSPAPVPLDRLRKLADCSSSVIKSLEKSGFLRIVDQPTERLPGYIPVCINEWTLTKEQSEAISTCETYLSEGIHKTVLLHGVTASGKTEVYLRLIEKTLDKGKNAILLVPEISLTAQLMDIFKTRFGDDVAVLHSALGLGERFDEWNRLHRGQAKVALGPRSAVLAPVDNLGLIVVDEEHDSSYKQLVDPRYHAKDLAIHRAKESDSLVILGSATPSLESYYLALRGDYSLIEMNTRIEERPLPDFHIVDMRDTFCKSPGSIFSNILRDAIRCRLDRKEQVIILQNRRAYASFLLCRECGHVPKCRDCAVAVRFHKGKSLLVCHHCGYEESVPKTCPKCDGFKIAAFGIGTEKVAEETVKEFPEAKILRMDRDTTSRKGSHVDIIRAFRNKEADILVGTQMVAKGLDFPDVTLVGVISADTSLNLPDFRASEKSFQLLSQVAGRSGRGDNPGEVIVQTFEPDHHAVVYAAAHDYRGFYNHELPLREELNYPPFSFLANITAASRNEEAADRLINGAFLTLKEIAFDGIEILGPAPCAIPFLRGQHRRHILIKSASLDVLRSLLNDLVHSKSSLVQELQIDLQPVSTI